MTASDIIKSWHTDYGVADQLRSAAMEIQEDHPEIDRAAFIAGAQAAGFNPSTAARCWAYVAAQ